MCLIPSTVQIYHDFSTSTLAMVRLHTDNEVAPKHTDDENDGSTNQKKTQQSANR